MNNISSQGNLFLDDFRNFMNLIDNLYYKCNFKLKLVVKKMNDSPLKNPKIDRGLGNWKNTYFQIWNQNLNLLYIIYLIFKYEQMYFM